MALEEVAADTDVVGRVFWLREHHERRGHDPDGDGDREDEHDRQEDLAAVHGVAPAAVTAQRASAALTQTG